MLILVEDKGLSYTCTDREWFNVHRAPYEHKKVPIAATEHLV